MEILKNNKIIIVLISLIFLLGCLRFIYSTTIKDGDIYNSIIYKEKALDSKKTEIRFCKQCTLTEVGRWGPLSKLLTIAVDSIYSELEMQFLVLKFLLLICYFYLIYLVVKTLNDFRALFNKKQSLFWSLLSIFILLQSSSVLYEINTGGAEIILGLSVIGNFYYFYKKKFFVSSLFILFGVFFKITPLMFLFPYFIYAMITRDNRKYFYYVILNGLVFSLISYPIAGLLSGSLYPLSIIIVFLYGSSVSDVIPIWSVEVFPALSFINKIIYGFKFDYTGMHPDSLLLFQHVNPTYQISNLMIFISKIFVLMLFLGLSSCVYILKKLYINEGKRLYYILNFQIAIGIIFFIFSLDFSIATTILLKLNILFPIFIISIFLNNLSNQKYLNFSIILLYLIGLTLIGNLMPISFLQYIIPYSYFDSVTGYDTVNIAGTFGSWNWYHIPMFGFFILFLSTGLSIKKLMSMDNQNL